ncbi:MAG: TVP38/TMEM64 family protein [Ilumatobacteraceae bacterium]|nr:TVP38/TMEM64 family protein [Ilumatobacteraceae bacterium]
MSRAWIQRIAVAAIWLGAVVLWRQYTVANDLSATEAAQQFIDAVGDAWWGILAYIAVYLARPIVLFPASVLTIVGGLLFGPVVGVIVVVVAANASALLAYSIGRLLGRRPGADMIDGVAPDVAAADASIAKRWSQRMRDNSFETVLIMRLLFLPYDLVNYLSGILRLAWLPFLLATALGSLPGTVSFVLLGASLERIDDGFGGIDPVSLVASIVIFLASLVIAGMVRSRQRPDQLVDDSTDIDVAEQIAPPLTAIASRESIAVTGRSASTTQEAP